MRQKGLLKIIRTPWNIVATLFHDLFVPSFGQCRMYARLPAAVQENEPTLILPNVSLLAEECRLESERQKW